MNAGERATAVANLPAMLRTLRLPTINRMWESLLAQAEEEQWGHAIYLAALCEQEEIERESRRIDRMTRGSGLPVGKTLSSFDFSDALIPYRARIEALAATHDW
ncbi:MAG: ATP-binding protein, partial [Mariprofundaceae bacterium]|nr:ATP-binding protein [Mariprofundaceae bacterium]